MVYVATWWEIFLSLSKNSLHALSNNHNASLSESNITFIHIFTCNQNYFPLNHSCVLGVGVWAEVQFSWHIRDNIDGVQSFLSNVSSISDGSAGSDTSSSDTLSLLFEFESSKYNYYTRSVTV